MMFKIGNIKIKNQVVLAPIAGISNPAFMRICEEMGVGYAVTELISSEAIVRNNQKTFDMLNGIDDLNIPVAVQLFGGDPLVMANAAKIITNKYKKVFIDINMGCPVPKIAIRSCAGSSLLKDPEKVKEIVSSVVKAVEVPVTVKIRSGWDENSINAPQIAKIIEDAGASAITIHGRTRSQGFSGDVDLQIIKEVARVVKIPVIGNGDIISYLDAQKMLDETECDAIMIGRGALGNPWLIRDCVNYLEKKELPQEVTIKDKKEMMIKHLSYLYQDKCEKEATLEIRSILLYYLKGIPNTKNIKNELMKCYNKEDYLRVIKEVEDDNN